MIVPQTPRACLWDHVFGIMSLGPSYFNITIKMGRTCLYDWPYDWPIPKTCPGRFRDDHGSKAIVSTVRITEYSKKLV